MKKLLFVSLALATALATSPAAKADSVFYFNLNGTCSVGALGCDAQANPGTVSISGSGYFTVTGSGPTFSITGASATIDGLAATLIVPGMPGVNAGGTYYALASKLTTPGYFGANQAPAGGFNAVFFNNKLTPALTVSTPMNTISFLLSDGSVVEIFTDNGKYWWNEVSAGQWLIDPNYNTDLNGEGADLLGMDISPTPEPSSLMLLGTGLLLMAGFLFRKAKPSMIQSA
jgi:hypothetical protein